MSASACVDLTSPVSIIRLPEVQKRTGLSRSGVYAKITAGEFPGQVSLGARAVGWIESDITLWINKRIAASRKRSS